jgi:exopolyphosphatase/pppGpp-phosphohydrolase
MMNFCVCHTALFLKVSSASAYLKGVCNMSTHKEAIHAAIDLGSNSAKMTIARILDDSIEIIASETAMMRLGESVNATGEIAPEKQDAVLITLQKYQQLAQQYEASSITVVATEAVRKAQHYKAFLKKI